MAYFQVLFLGFETQELLFLSEDPWSKTLEH